jgi:hypothetical protein
MSIRNYEDYQCGIRRNRTIIVHTFYIRQMMQNTWEYNKAMHSLFIDFKKLYDSVRTKVLYNILVMVIKICWNKIYANISFDIHVYQES